MIAGHALFKLHDQHGFSLVDSLNECRNRRIDVEWPSFLSSAKAHGWSWEKTTTIIRYALADACFSQSLKDVLNLVFDFVWSESK